MSKRYLTSLQLKSQHQVDQSLFDSHKAAERRWNWVKPLEVGRLFLNSQREFFYDDVLKCQASK